MQRGGIAVLIDDLVSLDAEPAVSVDKCLLPEARGYKGQTGKPNYGNPRNSAHTL
jgi:hypothetical protein